MAVGVGQREREAVRRSLGQRNLKRVVIGTAAGVHPPDREVVGQAVRKHSWNLRSRNHSRLPLLTREIEGRRANKLQAREGLSAEVDRRTGTGAIEAVVVPLLSYG